MLRDCLKCIPCSYGLCRLIRVEKTSPYYLPRSTQCTQPETQHCLHTCIWVWDILHRKCEEYQLRENGAQCSECCSWRFIGCDITSKCLSDIDNSHPHCVFAQAEGRNEDCGSAKRPMWGDFSHSSGSMPVGRISVTIRLMLRLGPGTVCLGLEVWE